MVLSIRDEKGIKLKHSHEKRGFKRKNDKKKKNPGTTQLLWDEGQECLRLLCGWQKVDQALSLYPLSYLPCHHTWGKCLLRWEQCNSYCIWISLRCSVLLICTSNLRYIGLSIEACTSKCSCQLTFACQCGPAQSAVQPSTSWAVLRFFTCVNCINWELTGLRNLIWDLLKRTIW